MHQATPMKSTTRNSDHVQHPNSTSPDSHRPPNAHFFVGNGSKFAVRTGNLRTGQLRGDSMHLSSAWRPNPSRVYSLCDDNSPAPSALATTNEAFHYELCALFPACPASSLLKGTQMIDVCWHLTFSLPPPHSPPPPLRFAIRRRRRGRGHLGGRACVGRRGHVQPPSAPPNCPRRHPRVQLPDLHGRGLGRALPQRARRASGGVQGRAHGEYESEASAHVQEKLARVLAYVAANLPAYASSGLPTHPS